MFKNIWERFCRHQQQRLIRLSREAYEAGDIKKAEHFVELANFWASQIKRG